MSNESINSVCMFTNLYPPVVSGSSTQSSFLAQGLVKQGINVSVVTSALNSTKKSYEIVEGVHVYRLPCLKLPRLDIALNFPWLNAAYLPKNRKRINDIIQKHRPDVLHLHNHMFDLAFAAVEMRRRYRIPLVGTIHTMIKHSDSIYNFILYPLDRVFLKTTVVRNIDIIISPDQNILAYAKKTFGGRKHHRIVPYGINPPAKPSKKNIYNLRKKFNLKGKRVILSIGHVHKIRDRRELIEAMELVLKKIPNAVLLIIGSVSTDIPFKIAKSLGIEHAIEFTGAVPHKTIGDYLSLADIEAHWLNQDLPERTSLGVASLECMAARKTVMSIANENTYGTGVLENGRNVILVEKREAAYIADIIVELLGNNKRLYRIGERAEETINRYFSWQKICADTIEVYSEAKKRYGIS